MFQLDIITPEKKLFSGPVSTLRVPGFDGELGILPKHENMFALLADGELCYKIEKKDHFLAIGGGYVEVKKDTVIVIVSRAVYADELNERDILKARESAEQMLKQDVTVAQRRQAQQLFQRSIIDLKILRRRRRHTNIP